MNDPNTTRRNVSEDYARAVVGGTGCCSGPTPSDLVARVAGYTDAELALLPDAAATSSFGCGNPLAFSAVQPGQVVLDLGSGAGIDLLLAARKVGPTGRVIGVDMTDEMIARATENIAASGLANVEVRKGIIEELPIDSESVDWVISNCVINLSPEKDRVFAEIARVTRPGGTMLVSDMVAEQIPAEVRDHRDLYSACLVGAITEQEYTAGLRAAGLVEVAVLDRVVYQASQIAMFIGECEGRSAETVQQARQWASRLEGKIASIKVRARKPA